jgi:ribosomal protein S18 acetylase RimI-like enzyme
VDVRAATGDEWATWARGRTERLADAVARWYGEVGNGARAEAERQVAAVTQAPRDRRELLVLVEEAPVAYVAVAITDRGLLDDVWVEPEHRRRGLGRAALDAGTRWLAERGQPKAVATIDVADPASVALCRTWTDLGQRMRLDLTDAPELPDGVTARPMTEAEFGSWLHKGIEGYRESLIESGSLDLAGATAKADRDFAEMLPDGLATPDATLTVLEAETTPVATLWLAHHRPGTRTFVLDVEVDAGARGRGYGRAAMLAAERIALECGDRSIGLNVFGHNQVARKLYASLGYQVTDRSLGLPLS